MRRRAALGRGRSVLRLRAPGFAASLLDGCCSAPRLPGNDGRVSLRKVRLAGGREPACPVCSVLSVWAACGASGIGAGCHSSAHGHGVPRAAEHCALADGSRRPQPHAGLPWPSALHGPGAVRWGTQMRVCFQVIRPPRGRKMGPSWQRVSIPSTASNQACCCSPVIPTFERWGQEDQLFFKAILSYVSSWKPACATYGPSQKVNKINNC